jgi:NAD(P)-dependent dehydrogenase (short-subunit alcohol dehydrogenase family)
MGRDVEMLAKLQAELAELSNGCESLMTCCDVRSEQQVGEAIAQVEKVFGGIDVLVNNAGTRLEADIEGMLLADWENILKTNLTGPFLLAKHCLPLLRKTNRGLVFNVSSIRGLYGGKGLTAYSSSKFGLIGLTQSLAEELARVNIKTYSICPAAMDTRMTKGIEPTIPESALIDPRVVATIINELIDNPPEPSGKTIVIVGKQKNFLRKIQEVQDLEIIECG